MHTPHTHAHTGSHTCANTHTAYTHNSYIAGYIVLVNTKSQTESICRHT